MLIGCLNGRHLRRTLNQNYNDNISVIPIDNLGFVRIENDFKVPKYSSTMNENDYGYYDENGVLHPNQKFDYQMYHNKNQI